MIDLTGEQSGFVPPEAIKPSVSQIETTSSASFSGNDKAQAETKKEEPVISGERFTVEGERVETIGKRRSKLLYHGTANRYDDVFVEHGLFADKVNLTANLEMALDYARGQSLLTCWYPRRKEVESMPFDITMPATPLSEEKRAQVLEGIDKKDLDPVWKDIYARVTKNAQTILPSSSLGAIIRLDYRSKIQFESILPSTDLNFLLNYANRREELVTNMEKLLNSLEITFFESSLNRRKLAEDIVRTELEHYLLGYGKSLGRLKRMDKPSLDPQQEQKSWSTTLQQLQGVSFQEPVYERYRQNLISRIIDYTGGLSTLGKLD